MYRNLLQFIKELVDVRGADLGCFERNVSQFIKELVDVRVAGLGCFDKNVSQFMSFYGENIL